MGGSWADVAASWPAGVFILLAGLCVGSFLNVCIHRLPAGKSLFWPPSHCTSCQARIAWYDNLPVVSYVVLGGRCRRCGARFSIRYPLVEAATGLLFLGYWVAYFRLGVRAGADHAGVLVVHLALVGAMLVSGVIDLERKEIYTSVTTFATAVGLAGSFLWPAVQRIAAYDRALPDLTGWARSDALVMALVGAAVGAALVHLTRVLATQAFKKEAMGLGDAHLMGAVGAVLGWEGAVLAFFVAPFLALPYGLYQVFRPGGGSDEEKGEKGPGAEGEEKLRRPPVPWLALGLMVAGLALVADAGLMARGRWSLGSRLALAAGLAGLALAFWLAGRQERRLAETHEEPARAPPSHEVPYGPFLGAAAAIVMLGKDVAMRYFGFR
jgi:leader peptidase (prepilin peptidase)/N-methyltransferase